MAKPGYFTQQAAKKQLELQESHAQKQKHALLEPLPNLFRGTFDQALHQAPGELWLQKCVQAFDSGGPVQRKQILQEFLNYVGVSGASSMEELFANQANLFFIRLTAWFSVTLSTLFEVPLQLKVFLAFLEFREQSFVRAFFEAGAVVPLMQSLSEEFDASEEVRCLAILALHKLAANGRHHKELLCSQGLISKVLECMADGLRWETLKCGGRLLCELLLNNPRHQAEVLDGLQGLLSEEVALTQRVGIQSFISLLLGERSEIPPLLCDAERHQALVHLALGLLESPDQRVGADAYCLLCHLMRIFNCDEMLFEFARSQLHNEADMESEWLRLELEGQDNEISAVIGDAPPIGGRHHGTVRLLHQRISEALASPAEGDEGLPAGAEGSSPSNPSRRLLARANRINAEFREAFQAEAGCVLKWGLMLYLANRNAEFRAELVEGGLAETLLMCLLDVQHPVRQAAALAELHRLRSLSPEAQEVAEGVLQAEDLLEASTLEQFMLAASPRRMAQARYRLRNLQVHGRRGAYSVLEHTLHQRMVERRVAESLQGGSSKATTAAAFLTETLDADLAGVALGEAAAHEEDKPKRIDDRLDRTAEPASDGTRSPSRPLEEVPFSGLLTSFVVDPLDVTADEESPLIQNLRSIESFVGIGAAKRVPSEQPPARPVCSGPQRTSHRPSREHLRAVALQPFPGANARRPPRARPAAGTTPRAASDSTDADQTVSAGRGAEASQWPTSRRQQASVTVAKGANAKLPPLQHQGLSLAETSVGLEPTRDFSREDFSRELPSYADSRATGSLEHPAGSLLESELEHVGHPMLQIVEKSPIVSLLERIPAGPVTGGSRARDGHRQILQVAQPPYHDCIAPDQGEEELQRQRQRYAEELSGLLRPATQRRFQELSAAGGFPRRSRAGARATSLESRPARAEAPAGPASARLPQPPPVPLPPPRRYVGQEEVPGRTLPQVAEAALARGWATPIEAPMLHGSPPLSEPFSSQQSSRRFSAQGFILKRPAPAMMKGTLKDFFPASALNVVAGT